jgi:hypothetical protein
LTTKRQATRNRETEHHALATGPGAWSFPTCAYAWLAMASKK